MQIRTIRGRNLASLAEEFEIDLTAEPLASAGLFAITGETGAGKSTILDAMCLALYGDCPRLSDNGINDDIPDAAGDTIKSKDARAILRRGAATGYAEVDFVAPDGVAYRAHWSTRRARNKADGRLQKGERALIRLSDGQVLESQVSAVNARVAEITGLQYPEFMRTVLLAQGDFDAFLVAGTGERAALLEKVTGTHVYRDISRRIYVRHDEAKNALNTLEHRRSGAIALSDEERSTLIEEQTTLVAEIKSLNVAIADQANKIQTHEKIIAAQDRVAAARAEEKQANESVAAATSDRDKLARLDEALGLRTEYERAVRAGKAVAHWAGEEDSTVARQSELAAHATEADTRYRNAKATLEHSERLVQSLEPSWAKATDLDGQIRTAAAEQSHAETALEAASKTASARTTELDKLTRQRANQAAALDNAETALAKEPGAQRLADAWDHVSGLIDERTEVNTTIWEKHGAAEAAQKIAANAEARLEELAANNRADQAAITEQEDTIRVSRKRLEAINQSDPGKQITRLAASDTAVKDMIRAVGEHEEANEAREKAVADQAAADTACQSARADASAAEKQIARATAAVNALMAPVDRAEAAASDQAVHLRQHLVDGQACPVCGATEHPVSANEALAGIARDMRFRLEAERKALGEATDNETQAARQTDAARLAIDAAAEGCKTAEGRIATAEAKFAEARAAAVETAQEPLPNSPPGAADALSALRKQTEADRLRLAALSEEETQLRSDIDRYQTQTAERRGAIESRDATRVAQEKIRNDKSAVASLAEQAAAHASERRETIDGQLAPVLAGVDRMPAIIDDKPQETRSALERIVHAYHQQLATRDTARSAIAELGPQISAAETARKNADTAVNTATTALENRRVTLLACRDERGQLFGGEDTETNRARHNQARTHAQKSHAEASEALSALRSEKTGVDERLASLRESLAHARTEDATACAALEAKLDDAGLTRAVIDALLAEGRPEADRLRAHLEEIRDALTRASSTASARQEDLQALIEGGVPDEPEPELRQTRAADEAARTHKQGRAGSINGQIEADDKVRAQLSDLDRQIASAKEVRDTWAAVNDAVGSARGDKFAQIAQGVTLAMLAERANQHLADLKPRYRLAQGGADLALHIVDRDMGDEIRSTRSLSGGERFLVSLSLALALSRMGGKGGLAATLFIDEGFGSLDSESLEIAIDALEALQSQGRTIGVISHVNAMKDRIPVRVHVARSGAGSSSIEILE